MIRVGCAGYPVNRDRYWRSLSFVEADTGKGMPKIATLEAWKADVPEGGETALQALRSITHGPQDAAFPPCGRKLPVRRQIQCGAFHDSLEVHEAWMATKAAAEALGAKIVVFETPPSFLPGPDRLRDLYRFFKGASRGKLHFVWHPRSGEWAPLVDKIGAELDLIRAFDPLRQPPPKKGAFLYMRPGVARGGMLTVDNMATIVAAAQGNHGYIVFSHRASFHDAERLKAGRR